MSEPTGDAQFGLLAHVPLVVATTTSVDPWADVASQLLFGAAADSTPAAPNPTTTGYLLVKYKRVRINAEKLDEFCRSAFSCECLAAPDPEPVEGVDWTYDGTNTLPPFDPDTVPGWFYQYVISNLAPTLDCSGPLGTLLLIICRTRIAAQIFINNPGMNVNDPNEWVQGGQNYYDGYLHILALWRNIGEALSRSHLVGIDDVTRAPKISVKYKRIRVPGEIVSEDCETIPVGEACPQCE